MDDTAKLEKIKLALLGVLVVVFSITAGLSLSRLTSKQALKQSSRASTNSIQNHQSCDFKCAQATGGKGRCIRGEIDARFECTRVGGLPIRCNVESSNGQNRCTIVESDNETCCVLGWSWDGNDSCSGAKTEQQCSDLNHWYQCGWDECSQKCFADILSKDGMRKVTCDNFNYCDQYKSKDSCDTDLNCDYYICADNGKGRCQPSHTNGQYICPQASPEQCAQVPPDQCTTVKGCDTQVECNGRKMCKPYNWPTWRFCEKYGT